MTHKTYFQLVTNASVVSSGSLSLTIGAINTDTISTDTTSLSYVRMDDRILLVATQPESDPAPIHDGNIDGWTDIDNLPSLVSETEVQLLIDAAVADAIENMPDCTAAENEVIVLKKQVDGVALAAAAVTGAVVSSFIRR